MNLKGIIIISIIFVASMIVYLTCFKSEYVYNDAFQSTKLYIEDCEVFVDSVYLNNEIKIDIPIDNRGNSTLKIDDISTDCDCTLPELNKSILYKGERDTIRVYFNPTYTGTIKKTLSIFSNNIDGVVVITITAKVIQNHNTF